jgi:excisionase family DNA binding protein
MEENKRDGKDFRGLLDTPQFAKATGWAESTVRQKVWLKQIEYVKLGRSVRFKPETVEQLIREGTVPPLAEKKN